MRAQKKIEPIAGWFLICREELAVDVDLKPCKLGDWYIAWADPFSTRKKAREFAKRNNWPPPYKAVRGKIVITQSLSSTNEKSP